MAQAKQAYTPTMTNAAVKAKTGKDWAGWFEVLDRAGAAKLDHRRIAAILTRKYGLPGWWCQNITVEYERARGLRERHETSTGFSVTLSRTLATSLPHLYAATANAARRRRWFPRGAFEPSSQTKDKYFRGAWNRKARLEIGFYAKGSGKARIALQIRRLAKKGDVEVERKAWRAAVAKLQEMLEH